MSWSSLMMSQEASLCSQLQRGSPPENIRTGFAQAGNAPAYHPEGNRALHGAKTKSKGIDNSSIAKVLAEEDESNGKSPSYPDLARWELLESIGSGAFSDVYRARDLEGNAGEVAIKVVRKLEGDKQRANILKEVQIMRQLDHPNVIKLIDFSEAQQYYYMILELALGGELFHQLVRLTYFSEDLSRHVITQVAKAVEYLHEEKGVVHRDVKPENILYNPVPFVPSKNPRLKQPGDEDKVDEGEFMKGIGSGGIGQIKIADFGLSKIIWDDQTTTPCGTTGYTAPEIVKDEQYSKSVDMWGIGCVLYMLLCGFPPFCSKSVEALTEKVANGQYVFPSPWWDNISETAQDLISHLFTVDPDKRYTIKEFLQHPWILQSAPTQHEEKQSMAEVSRAFDAFKVVDCDRRLDLNFPGTAYLREVSDTGLAVHRQEEDKRRKQMGGLKAGRPSHLLAALNETDENKDDDNDAKYVRKPASQHLEQSERNTTLGYQKSGRDPERRPERERGCGQHSAPASTAAKQQIRDRNRQMGPFELNLDGATLLRRRGMKPAVRMGRL
ncbi:hypothetical protein FOBRF1_007023 [Fusarium oxysporum]